MEEPKDHEEEVQVPEDRVEDLEPEGGESADVAGGGKYKPARSAEARHVRGPTAEGPRTRRNE